MSNGWLDFWFSLVIYLLKLMATFHLGGIDLISRTLSSVCFVFVFLFIQSVKSLEFWYYGNVENNHAIATDSF